MKNATLLLDATLFAALALAGCSTPEPSSAPAGALQVALGSNSGSTNTGNALIPSVNFGDVEVGCSADETLSIQNVSNAPVTIGRVSLVAGPAFTVGGAALPVVLQPGESITLALTFAPQGSGADSGTLVIGHDAGDPLEVPINGIGIAAAQSDTFTQPMPMSDILFVIDNSGSMADEQATLAANTPAILANLQGHDFRIAVTTTDPSQGGAFEGPVITIATPNPTGALAAQVVVGTNGSAIEQGLGSSQLALTNPGFLRGGASLTVIYVSDEEDYSPEPTSFYERFLLGLSNDVTVNAIIGDGNPACHADLGTRYLDLVQATSGTSVSICAADWSPALAPNATLNDRFPLSGNPIPASITVTVDGAAAAFTYDAATNEIVLTPPAPGAQIVATYNLVSSCNNLPELTVSPAAIDFGILSIGCDDSDTINIANTSNAPATITAATLSGTDFLLAGTPLPQTLAPAETLTLTVAYQPIDVGSDNGTVVIDSDAGSFTVDLAGEGVDTTVTDAYQQTGPAADVLFVVDNSGSMADEQANLSANFPILLSHLQSQQIDYRIAVTTTDIGDGGAFNGDIISPVTADPAAAFAASVQVGTNGSAMEQGLATSALALSGNFLRSNASHTVIYLSDEEDHSPDTSAFYINFLQGLSVTAHAIVDDGNGTCPADHGARYLAAVSATGGTSVSICAADYSSVLTAISADLLASFALSQAPIPGTIQVTVDGTLNTAWQYDAAANAVRFANPPASGAQIDISYEIVSSCGPTPGLSVAPAQIDFGALAVGCSPASASVTVTNNGTAPESISAINLAAGDFTVATPSLPLVLAAGDSATLDLSYAPSDVGNDQELLQIVGSVTLVVSLSGAGVYPQSTSDTFNQLAAPRGDILFVVDSSGSMADERAALANTFGTLLTHLQAGGVDYQIGITTMDVTAGGAQGGLVGTTKVITPSTPNAFQVFSDNLNVGMSGAPIEQGLAASKLALTNGANPGFLRDDAWLTVIYVSDEEDQSPETTLSYIDYLENVKGAVGAARVQANAIVGWPTACSSSRGSADHGARYGEVAQRTGGVVESICTASWSGPLTNLGGAGYGLLDQFQLSGAPAPASIVVEVDGAVVQDVDGSGQNWWYDTATNSILFIGAAIPAPGATITVTAAPGC